VNGDWWLLNKDGRLPVVDFQLVQSKIGNAQSPITNRKLPMKEFLCQVY
jgi:hypothetical protein